MNFLHNTNVCRSHFITLVKCKSVLHLITYLCLTSIFKRNALYSFIVSSLVDGSVSREFKRSPKYYWGTILVKGHGFFSSLCHILFLIVVSCTWKSYLPLSNTFDSSSGGVSFLSFYQQDSKVSKESIHGNHRQTGKKKIVQKLAELPWVIQKLDNALQFSCNWPIYIHANQVTMCALLLASCYMAWKINRV